MLPHLFKKAASVHPASEAELAFMACCREAGLLDQFPRIRALIVRSQWDLAEEPASVIIKRILGNHEFGSETACSEFMDGFSDYWAYVEKQQSGEAFQLWKIAGVAAWLAARIAELDEFTVLFDVPKNEAFFSSELNRFQELEHRFASVYDAVREKFRKVFGPDNPDAELSSVDPAWPEALDRDLEQLLDEVKRFYREVRQRHMQEERYPVFVREIVQRRVKIGRNDPCPCGSGKKHKKCCLGKPD